MQTVIRIAKECDSTAFVRTGPEPSTKALRMRGCFFSAACLDELLSGCRMYDAEGTMQLQHLNATVGMQFGGSCLVMDQRWAEVKRTKAESPLSPAHSSKLRVFDPLILRMPQFQVHVSGRGYFWERSILPGHHRNKNTPRRHKSICSQAIHLCADAAALLSRIDAILRPSSSRH